MRGLETKLCIFESKIANHTTNIRLWIIYENNECSYQPLSFNGEYDLPKIARYILTTILKSKNIPIYTTKLGVDYLFFEIFEQLGLNVIEIKRNRLLAGYC